MDVKEKPTRSPAVAKRQAPDFSEQLIEPFTQLRNEVNRLFESFPLGLPGLEFARLHFAAPAIEMSETDKSYKITAELPGIEPDNVDVTFDRGILRIAGEKRERRSQKERGYRLSERSYGAFERFIELPSVDAGQAIKTKFKRGVLTVNVPKAKKAKKGARRNKVGA
ncbi:Hsp20/alpha crystallin family protein [Sphingomonas sp. G124]|uniref:Hsp20/alpha crystallin family protein n=1 Tax=Sphingomonas cremea TaxID=2904799 RepID=A0A9X1QK19_9SPHN|nr:Hsp20/alpha crystallin family protein [Sphingomonas cremea]MCF2514535.1 Hsp20/alpha crystallin family protein [Sphingomonas cremea]